MTTTHIAQILFAGFLPLTAMAYILGRKTIRAQQDPQATFKASENLHGWYG